MCLINVLGLITIPGGKFSKIDKNPGLNDCPERIFHSTYQHNNFLENLFIDRKILKIGMKIR